ncbi:MAG: GlxA family transcriptional regulator [Woeseiaceae bacterium]|nr:GlxA family transcriptional regulator [Woeseiaceae bacterium]
MFGARPVRKPQHIAFLLLPRFSMMAFTSSVEPLRAANRQSGEELYTWQTLSVDGERVAASNDVVIDPHASIHDPLAADAVVVCAGVRAYQFNDAAAFARLQELARSGMTVGGICSGSVALARSGLLKGYRCTIHWEYVEPFVENFPELDVTATLFEIDRSRFTCSGGTAPLDMMINSIAMDHGEDLALRVAEQMVHTFVRHPHDAQRMPVQHRIGVSNPKLLGAIAHMEAFLENPVSLNELARSAGLSTRQLERLFRDNLQQTPSRYYLDLRLRRARLLLRQTGMTILQVAVASGFSSASHFARRYREWFEHSPRDERAFAEALHRSRDARGESSEKDFAAG